MDEKIEHTGVILAIFPDKVLVAIEQSTACEGCHAKEICHISGKKRKIIQVNVPANDFQVNEPVIVEGKRSLGLLAVWYAFGLPLLLAFSSLIVFKRFLNETYIALAMLGVFTLYYTSLYFFRNRLRQKFVFYLKKYT